MCVCVCCMLLDIASHNLYSFNDKELTFIGASFGHPNDVIPIVLLVIRDGFMT